MTSAMPDGELPPDRMYLYFRLRALAQSVAGFDLEPRHLIVMLRRLSRSVLKSDHTRPEAYARLDQLIRACENGDAEGLAQFIRILTTKHTSFFRNARHFDLAAEHGLWVAQKRGKTRMWCAATSTGQEPWSLAMALADVFSRQHHDQQRRHPTLAVPPAPPLPFEILATDIDLDAIAVAQAGDYSDQIERTMMQASPLMSQYLHSTARPSIRHVDDRLRPLVRFAPLNLIDRDWPDTIVAPPYDVIFCRNVLMYFDEGNRESVLCRLAGMLADDGLLFLDPAEHMGTVRGIYHSCGNGVYTLLRRQLRGGAATGVRLALAAGGASPPA